MISLSTAPWDNTSKTKLITVFYGLFCLLAYGIASADDDAELAKKLANPVAALISVPIQFNYDSNFGIDDDGSVFRMNVQPVIPLSISDDWNMISRTMGHRAYCCCVKAAGRLDFRRTGESHRIVLGAS
jgi:hypothetical protein